MEEEEEESRGLTEGVPSAASSLDDGRRIGSRNTQGIHAHTPLHFWLSASLSIIHTYCYLSGLVSTPTRPYLPSLSLPLSLPLSLLSPSPSSLSLSPSLSSSCCVHQRPSLINHYNTQYTAIGEWFYLLLPSSTTRQYIFTTCGISGNQAINPKHCLTGTASLLRLSF